MNSTIDVGHVTLRNKLIRSIWNVVYILLFRPFGTKLFLPWRLFVLKLFGAKVCWNSGVYSSTKIWAPWNLVLGHNSWLGPNVICYNQALVTLEDDVTISQYSYICTAGHKINTINTYSNGLIVAPVTFQKCAWVGTRAFIGMGVVVGENAIVGAAACVFKDVEPMTIVGGNPAKIIKKRELK